MTQSLRKLALVSVSLLVAVSANVALAGGGNSSSGMADDDTVLCYAPKAASAPRYFTPTHITLSREPGQKLLLDLTIKSDVGAQPFFDNHTKTVRVSKTELASKSLVDGVENVVKLKFDANAGAAVLSFVSGPSAGLEVAMGCSASRARNNSWIDVNVATALDFILRR